MWRPAQNRRLITPRLTSAVPSGHRQPGLGDRTCGRAGISDTSGESGILTLPQRMHHIAEKSYIPPERER